MLNSIRNLLLLTASRLSGYLLQDEFTTALSAGSVNGTAADPGPGSRTVVDTESKLSITGGALVFAGQKTVAAFGDPGFWLNSITRIAGRILLVNTTFLVANKETEIGFDTDQASLASPGNTFYFRSTGNLQSVDGSTGSPTFSVYTATTYSLIVILRASGAFYIIKGGVYSAWTILWFSAAPSTATMYPAITNFSHTNTADYLRIPYTLWLPTPLASDGFGSSFGSTDGLGHAEGVNGGVGAGGNGLTWTHNTYSISGAKALNTPGKGSELLLNTTFDTDTSNWTAVNATLLSLAGGQSNNGLQITSTSASASTAYAYQAFTTVANDWLLADFYHNNGTQTGGVKFATTSSGTDIKNYSTVTDASYTHRFASARATGTTTYIRLTLSAGGIGDTTLFDEFGIKKLTLADLFASVSVSTADVVAEIAVVVGPALDAGLVLNLDSTSSPANLVIVYVNRADAVVTCIKYVAGTVTQQFATGVTYSSGAVLRVAKIATVYRIYYNNLFVNSATISDAGITSNTKHGLFSTDPNATTLDNLVIYASGTGSEYAVLDGF